MDQAFKEKLWTYPPGGILIWIILSIEILTFIPGLMVFLWERLQAPAEFAASAQVLNSLTGSLNTAVLLTSGWFMANSLAMLRAGAGKAAWRWLLLTLLFGAAFLIIKGAEYSDKLAAGYDMGFDTFFTMYWLITGFHYIHVLAGVTILLIMAVGFTKKNKDQGYRQNFETAGIFWHMCDLIWVMVFPVFYLLR